MSKSKFEAALDEMLEDKIFQNHIAKDYVLNSVLECEGELAKSTKQELLILIRKAFVVICIERNEKADVIKENTDNIVKLNFSENKNIEHLEDNIDLSRKIKVIKIALPFFKEASKKEARSENSSNAGRKRAENNLSSQTLKKIAELEYPLKKHMFHIRGHSTKFITDMHAKFPKLARSSIETLITKLNKENGISLKK